jgi:uncharacterized membrane protein
MATISYGLHTGVWLCAVALGTAGSIIIAAVAGTLLATAVRLIIKAALYHPSQRPNQERQQNTYKPPCAGIKLH